MKNWIQKKLAVLFGNYLSLHRTFTKKKAKAIIFFVEGKNKEEGSIRVEMDGMIYFFEGKLEIEEYKNAEGKNVLKKSLNYGGWEMDMTHPKNKLF